MKAHHFALLCIITTLVFSCKKQQKEESLPDVSFGDVTYQTTKTTATASFKLSRSVSGDVNVYISTDSATLATTKVSDLKAKAVYSESDGRYNVSFGSLNIGATYWAMIALQTEPNKFVYSKITKFTTASYGIKWQAGFSKQIKLEEAPLFKDIILQGEDLDPAKENYTVSIGSINCQLWKIEKNTASGMFLLYVQVPASTPKGNYVFTIKYKSAVIFNDNLTVLQGNLYYLNKVSDYPYAINTTATSHFSYNQKIYVIDWLTNRRMDVMDIATGTWKRVNTTLPASNMAASSGPAFVINGVVYFPPASFGDKVLYFHTYSIQNNTWNTISVTGGSISFSATQSAFVQNGKLYYIIKGPNFTDLYGPPKAALMVFDPETLSNNVVMDLDIYADYKAISLENKIYLVTAQVENQSLLNYKYSLFELNPATKVLTKKNDVFYNTLPVGRAYSNIFSYQRKICLYGGLEYVNSGQSNPDIYYFDIATEKWTHLFLSPNFDIPSLGGFSYSFDSEFYIGLGRTMNGQETNKVWKFTFNE